METELEQVARFLSQASSMFSNGELEQACEFLAQAADILDMVTAATALPITQLEPPPPLIEELEPVEELEPALFVAAVPEDPQTMMAAA